MTDIFLGWDVGAWNCDRNRQSRDALCALEVNESGIAVVGKPWRGNLREIIVGFEGPTLIDKLLEQVGIDADHTRHLTIAIDTPLGWPSRMVKLVTTEATADVPEAADKNPYLFRAQELKLFTAGHRPLSMVRDMIGSQSTKGIHFLRRAQLLPHAPGVWGRNLTFAIESYPAAAVQDKEILKLTKHILDGVVSRDAMERSEAWQGDIRDAITCALVARLHRHQPDYLEAPSDGVDPAEGWIWLPNSSHPPEHSHPRRVLTNAAISAQR
jgi:hypothetical protein